MVVNEQVKDLTQQIEAKTDVVTESIQGSFLDAVVWVNNPLSTWLFALALGVGLYLVLRLGTHFTIRQIERITHPYAPQTLSFLKQFLLKILRLLHPLSIALLALYVGSVALDLPKNVEAFLQSLPVYAIVWQLGCWARPLTQLSLSHYVETRSDEKERLALQTLMGPVVFLVVVMLWMLLLLVILGYHHVEITPLLTSLGIGGIAVGLALKNILGDLFASLSIALDKPFVIDEFIISQDFKGTVKHIGLKSTRLESIDGELLVIPNNDLTSSRLRNYSRLKRRRVVHQFGVHVEASGESLSHIKDWITHFFLEEEACTLDRVHLTKTTTLGLDFEVVYYVDSGDYNLYMDIHERYLLGLLAYLRSTGIAFAQAPYSPF